MIGRRGSPAPSNDNPIDPGAAPAFPLYRLREQIADGVVQAIALVASLAAAVAIVAMAVGELSAIPTLSLVAYALGLTGVFAFSAGYHWVSRPAWKEILRRLDHAAIFVMIAGSCTPFALVKVGGPLGYGVFAVVWAVAILGVALKLLLPRRFERTALILYVLQGWAVLAAVEPLILAVAPLPLLLFAAGGALYTIGVGFHVWHRLPYQNAIWHGFVLAAAGCQYAAILEAVVLA